MFIVITVITIFLLISLILWYQERERRIDFEERINTLESKNKELYTDKLKFQLQPHALSNILMHLQITASKMNKGMDALSETLEYILYEGKQDYVCIEKEVQFIDKYLNLNKLFIQDKSAVVVDKSELDIDSIYYKKKCIPHLFSACFIENAFKHGDLNDKDFLQVSFSIIENTFHFTVKNKIKNGVIKNDIISGIGIKNLKERLEILSPEKYSMKYKCTDKFYIAKLSFNLK